MVGVAQSDFRIGKESVVYNYSNGSGRPRVYIRTSRQAGNAHIHGNIAHIPGLLPEPTIGAKGVNNGSGDSATHKKGKKVREFASWAEFSEGKSGRSKGNSGRD